MTMFEELYAPIPDVDRYLSRIRFTDPVQTDRDTLDALMRAHLSNVPFENIDSYDLNRPISLSTSALYDKIVAHGRGGYCFELNGLFTALLIALGFTCYNVAARVRWGKDYFPPLSHRACVVVLNGRRTFCDVGFGGPTATGSLLLDDSQPQSVGKGVYRFSQADGEVVLHCRTESGEAQLLSFADRPVDPVDFIALNHYYSSHPNSYFKSRRMAYRLSESGRVSLEDNVLRRTGEQPVELQTRGQIAAALCEWFGIRIDEEALHIR